MCGYGNQKELELQHFFPKGKTTWIISSKSSSTRHYPWIFSCLLVYCGPSKLLSYECRFTFTMFSVFAVNNDWKSATRFMNL